MSFYSNTHSKVRVVSPEEILREELPLGDTFRLVFDEFLDMTFTSKENNSENIVPLSKLIIEPESLKSKDISSPLLVLKVKPPGLT